MALIVFDYFIFLEIKRAVEALSAKVTEETPDHEEDLGRRVMLSEAILVPVDKYPEVRLCSQKDLIK